MSLRIPFPVHSLVPKLNWYVDFITLRLQSTYIVYCFLLETENSIFYDYLLIETSFYRPNNIIKSA